MFLLMCLPCRVVYVWGYNGYCRLGLGNQVDVLKPKVVPQVCILTHALSFCELTFRNDSFPVLTTMLPRQR